MDLLYDLFAGLSKLRIIEVYVLISAPFALVGTHSLYWRSKWPSTLFQVASRLYFLWIYVVRKFCPCCCLSGPVDLEQGPAKPIFTSQSHLTGAAVGLDSREKRLLQGLPATWYAGNGVEPGFGKSYAFYGARGDKTLWFLVVKLCLARLECRTSSLKLVKPIRKASNDWSIYILITRPTILSVTMNIACLLKH